MLTGSMENAGLPSVSADGVAVELLANINGVADAALAAAAGAAGVGLYRTEYLFLTHPSVPDEEEQYQNYKAVIEAAPNRTVTIRTLDLGGDKQVPYFGHQGETNPFMGFRSIRLSYAYPEFFRTQLRAIHRAAAGRQGGTAVPDGQHPGGSAQPQADGGGDAHGTARRGGVRSATTCRWA